MCLILNHWINFGYNNKVNVFYGVQDVVDSSGRSSPVARPANMNHSPAADRQTDNVSQVEEMETQEG